MGINTNLNISPYFDDYDAEKQYVRVLFKPARAVQARELTQLQTMLQTQIERFGNNIYQEGTIIEGVNPSVRDDIKYVKINDQVDLNDMTIYNQDGLEVKYYLTGRSSGLRAEIVAGANGFQTRDPDLKTFFINYLISAQPNINDPEIKQFLQGELLSIEDANGEEVATVTTASVEGHVGSSYSVSVSDGIIYQRGHFNYVTPQLIIVSKYDNSPDGVSIGFDVTETIVDTAIDDTLLDNAQGFNNLNAPGADRLQLTPVLAAYETAERPVNFFTLIRLERGKPIFIRSTTQFNSIERELARRTYDESGSYVVKGLNVTVDQDADGTVNAVIGPGKAYAFGYEVNNLNNRRLPIEPAAFIGEKDLQSVGVAYGGYLEFNMADRVIGGQSDPALLSAFNFEDRYTLYGINTEVATDKGPIIGECSIRNIEPGISDGRGRIYIYAITKNTGYKNARIGWVGETPVLNGQIIDVNSTASIFDTGRTGMVSASSLVVTRKIRKIVGEGGLTVDGNNQMNIPATINGQETITPVGRGIFGVDAVGQIVQAVSINTQYNSNDISQGVAQIQVTFDSRNAQNMAFVYYDAIVSNIVPDALQEVNVWVQTTFEIDNNFGPLGLPNVVSVTSVQDEDGNDLTPKFRLDNNQKDGYYGLSYLTLKTGETVGIDGDNAINLKVNMIALKRSFTGQSGMLTADSYANINVANVKPFTGKNGVTYDLINSFDFRPYAREITQYSTSQANPPIVPSGVSSVTIDPCIPIGNNTAVVANMTYYLPRYDKVAINKQGDFVIMKGQPSDNPSKVNNISVFGLADLFVPSNKISSKGVNAVKASTNTIRNYTMEAIRSIERRVDTVVDILALSLLEQQTKDLFIPDANGLNRFKNGIIVDQFKDLNIADLVDDEYRAAIERGATVLTPLVKQFPVDLKIDGATSKNITTFDDITTIDASAEQLTLIEQQYATNFRNLVTNYYSYKGNMLIFPKFDADYDVTEEPGVTLDIDLATPLLDLVEGIQEFVPLTNTTRTNTQRTGATRNQGGFRVTPMLDTFRTEFLNNDVYNINQDLGTFITDFSITPYMASRDIQIAVSGLRPNTRHYFYFDGVDINQHVFPGSYNQELERSLKASDVFRAGQKGAAVKTDQYGRLFAVYSIPTGTFYVGDAEIIISDSDQFTSIESAGTSIARETYRAYSFAVNKKGISADIRTADFFIDDNVWTQAREQRVRIPRPDPLAQTFIIRNGQDEDSTYIFSNTLDLFFKRKSKAEFQNGVTVQIRETSNGYPSAEVVPFGSKHIDWDEVNVSDDSSAVTQVTFDNPIRLEVSKEYCIVLIPDANDPDYLAFTAVVGEPDLINEEVAVASDWGDGMLFSSTNNSAWKPYDNEDLKFKIYKMQFSTEEAYVDLIPNDTEFLLVENPVGNFRNDEYAYFLTTDVYSATLQTNGQLTVGAASTFEITVGDIIHVNQAALNQFSVGRVSALQEVDGQWIITMKEPPPLTPGAANVTLCIGGKVAYWNRRRGDRLHLKESSVRDELQYALDGTEQIVGADSGAYATISVDGIFNAPVSYFQPFIMQTNTIRTRTDLALFKQTAELDALQDNSGEAIPFYDNAYMTASERFIPSKQNIINAVDGSTPDRFRLRLDLINNGYRLVTPTIDNTLSLMQVYEYQISDAEVSSSKYISKEVVLQPDMYAQGLKVILAAYRPAGTVVDVFGRFVYPYNTEEYSDWVKLENQTPDFYSTTANIRDYREFTYNLSEADEFEDDGTTPKEYTSFQLKIVLRHATDSEMNDLDLFGIVRGKNLFPHVYDYRAIALT